jgi:hypothetical protein
VRRHGIADGGDQHRRDGRCEPNPQCQFSAPKLHLEIVKIAQVEEQSSRGREGDDLGSERLISEPIQPPRGQPYRYQEHGDITREEDDSDVGNVVTKDPDHEVSRPEATILVCVKTPQTNCDEEIDEKPFYHLQRLLC